MQNSKSLSLLVFALIALAVSIVLTFIWGYRFYFDKPEKPLRAFAENPSVVAAHQDTVERSIDSLLVQLQASSVSSPADSQLLQKVQEYKRLRNDILFSLRLRQAADSAYSHTKLAALEQRLDELANQNEELKKQNSVLNEAIERLSPAVAPPASAKGRRIIAGKLPLLVSRLRLNSTSSRIEGSFLVNIRPGSTYQPEIYIRVIQPDGTLITLPGAAGSFKTDEGMKKYSVTASAQALDKDNRLQFSLPAPSLQKGNYILEIYHEGVMIGKLRKSLW